MSVCVCLQDVMIAEQKQLLEHSKLDYHKKLQVVQQAFV